MVMVEFSQNGMEKSNESNKIKDAWIGVNLKKDLLCYLCLGGFVLTLWSVTEEAASSNNSFKCNCYSVNSAKPSLQTTCM